MWAVPRRVRRPRSPAPRPPRPPLTWRPRPPPTWPPRPPPTWPPRRRSGGSLRVDLRYLRADDHHFVAFGVGDPPAVLGLVKEPATGCDGRGEACLCEVRRHGELEVDAVALPAPLGLRSVDLLEHQHRIQLSRIVDVEDPGSPVVCVPE